MIYVAICDDETRIGAELEQVLLEIFVRSDIKYVIDVYFTGKELYNKIETGAYYDLIFLDIEFAHDEINGVEVGTLIRESQRNDRVAIVFISWEKKYSLQLFDIRPLNFLVKPLDYVKVEKVVKTYLRLSGIWSGEFTYKIGRDILKVQIRDIIYLESRDRKLILHLADGRKEEFYGALKDVFQEQLQKSDFLLIHSSYAVNYDYVEILKYDSLTLKNRETPLPISQNKRKEVREVYCEIKERRRL